MMASPRKFSEKIALHTQKQAEGTAAFEQIMKEVGSATKGAYPPKQLLHINQALGSYRGGSLPNVNQIGSNSIDLQFPLEEFFHTSSYSRHAVSANPAYEDNAMQVRSSALNSLEDMKQGRDTFIDRVSRSRHVGPHRRPFDKRPVHLRNLACTALTQNAKLLCRDVDVSPYGSPYLSPPPDTSWRRTNSDSALHQSAMNPVDTYQSPSTPPTNRRNMHEYVDSPMTVDESQTKTYWDPKKQLLPPQHSRPKSCEVPGINIFHTEQDPGVVHIPVSSNTGSLPDLTNLQFQSPLQKPLDDEDQLTDVYSTNQQQLSPTAMSSGIKLEFPSGSNGGGVAVTGNIVQSSSNNSHRRANHGVTNLVIRGNSVLQNSLKVPSHNSLLHFSKGMTIDAGSMPMDTFSQQSVQANQADQYVLYQHQFGIPSPPDLNNVSGAQTGNYRSGSPSEPLCSAPPSPVSQTSPTGSPGLGPPPKNPFTDHYYLHTQANTLQEHFEQINMVDAPHSSSMNNLFNQEANNLQYSQISAMAYIDTGHYYNMSSQQLNYSSRQNQSSVITSGGQCQQTAPQTPQTPSSIPDIILTDFSSGADDPMSRHEFVKDLGSAIGMNSQFDSELLISDDLRGSLDPLDFDGLQLLTDPDMVTDSATEDSFRLDRL